jgi:cardiolipin synthase
VGPQTLHSSADTYRWLTTGTAFYAAVTAAIHEARQSVRLETYCYTPGQPGDQIRAALTQAARRGVSIQVLVDGFGSRNLPSGYWDTLRQAGGRTKVFNPLRWSCIACRNHRKLLVCDDQVAFVGGFNITAEENGDGVSAGWRDLGLRLAGSLAAELAASFDALYARAELRPKRLPRLRLPAFLRRGRGPHDRQPQLLESGPAGTRTSIKGSLSRDLRQARNVRIISAYFLPTWRLRKALLRLARRGGDVQFVTAGRSDVPAARLAGRTLYHKFMSAGIRIFEYEAQVLHTKLLIIDDVVYVGSANLDSRSLNINYELLIRLDSRQLALEAGAIFADHLEHCRQIEPGAWERSRSLWEKLKERLAYYLLARVDPFIARRQLRRLR